MCNTVLDIIGDTGARKFKRTVSLLTQMPIAKRASPSCALPHTQKYGAFRFTYPISSIMFKTVCLNTCVKRVKQAKRVLHVIRVACIMAFFLFSDKGAL